MEEYYRVRYTSERMYLLDYERTMTQIPDTGRMYANDKILLGITDENVDMMESTDGNTVVFSDRGQLLCYNAVTNGLTVIFSSMIRTMRTVVRCMTITVSRSSMWTRAAM